MLRRERPVLPFADESEELYRRIHPNEWKDGAWADQLKFTPSMSVNRRLPTPPHCLAHQVLYPDVPDAARAIQNFQTNAVLTLTAGLVPGPYQFDEIWYSWQFFHEPVEFNYAHSELWTGKNGEFAQDTEVTSKIVKANFRQDIIEMARVTFKPGEAAYLYGT